MSRLAESKGHAASRTPTYVSWKAMRHRVRTHPRYANISIDERWDNYLEFLRDMGERPAGRTLDRIDSTGDYTPANCRWADDIQQASNRSNNKFHEVDGVSYTQAQLARKYGLSVSALSRRLQAGADIKNALGI